MKHVLIGILFIVLSYPVQAQKGDKAPRYLGEAITVDSSSIILIPTRYNEELLSANKLALWNDFYANIIFYDLASDSYRKLFSSDTFIKPFPSERINHIPRLAALQSAPNTLPNTSSQWIFYFVKSSDYNGNGRIDDNDPTILYVSDKAGNQLKALTPDSENAIAITVYEKLGYALVKMQRDSDNNKRFEGKDKDFYFVRVDLKDLTFGKKVEINQ